jgi:HSP20 family protein
MVSRLIGSDDFATLRDAMDRLFSESLAIGPARGIWSSVTNGNGGARTNLPLDVYATDSDVFLIAAVPGIEPGDIELTVNQNTVTFRGEIKNVASSEEAKNATWYLHELPYGKFQRSLTLPVEIDSANADATFDHGILRLRLPKSISAQPKQIKVRTFADHEPQSIESGSAQES